MRAKKVSSINPVLKPQSKRQNEENAKRTSSPSEKAQRKKGEKLKPNVFYIYTENQWE